MARYARTIGTLNCYYAATPHASRSNAQSLGHPSSRLTVRKKLNIFVTLSPRLFGVPESDAALIPNQLRRFADAHNGRQIVSSEKIDMPLATKNAKSQRNGRERRLR